MKKFLFALLCVFCYTACGPDDDTKPKSGADTIDDLSGKLQGEWVYDTPSEGVWEKMKFTSSGVFYFSNDFSAWEIHNDRNDGRYFIEGNDVTCTYFLEGVSQQIVLTIEKITDYSFTAKFKDTGLRFTYAKQIDTKQMKQGEVYMPKYTLLIRSEIIGYSSHDANVAKVDASTGAITAISAGRTYIDVVTQDGKAVVEIQVEEQKYFMAYDYTQYIGKTKKDVTDTFEFLYTTDGNTITYNYLDGSEASKSGMVKDKNWKAITFQFDNNEKVVAIGMEARDDVWFTNEEMSAYLAQNYTVYEKGTTNTYKAFLNAGTFDEATVGIVWDYSDRTLVFVQIVHASQPAIKIDYSNLLGQTHSGVKNIMSGMNPLTDTDETLTYMVQDDYVLAVTCSFKDSKKNLTDVVQSVQVRLQSGVDQELIKTELAKKYVYSDGVEGDYLMYFSTDYKIQVIYYQGTTNVIKYVLR